MTFRLLLTARLAAIAACILILPACRRAPSPPSATSVPEVRTVVARPVEIAGHESCVECHREIAAAHLTTGHARTFALTKDSAAVQQLCGMAWNLPAPYGRYEYTCDVEGAMVAIPLRFGERAFPLEYAIGSGDHAVTFFSLMQRSSGETVGIEHRLTWFRSEETFDITPGQQDLVPSLEAEFFGRVIEPQKAQQCIECHTTTVAFDGPRVTNLYPGVHCEVCHGPAADHVKAAKATPKSENPGHLLRPGTAAEEMELCGRCHRTAKDITLERLADYPLSVIRFQPVGLMKSQCFLKTDGGLRCSHCHDPHEPAAARSMERQVATCLECHSGPDKTPCKVSPTEGCIQCHLPPVNLVRGIAFHDHWIRIRTERDAPAAKSSDADHTTSK